MAVTLRRIFRAFFWLRWRVLVNSLERTGSRDLIERFSMAAGKLGPIMVLVMLIPSSIGLFVLGIAAGFGTAADSMVMPMEVLRYLTFVAVALTVVGPIVLPTRDGGSITRLLLLPIPRTALYMAQVAGALADPWVALLVPTLVGVPIGMAVGLSASGTLVALAAGVCFLLLILGVASLASSILHLLLRDRRRGDLVMLFLVFVLPILAIAPQVFLTGDVHTGGRKLTKAERVARPPSTAQRVALRVLPFTPSEMYYRAAKNGLTPVDSVLPLAGLALAAAGMQLAGYAAYRRVLDLPATQSTRRAGSLGGLWNRVIPGLSPAASAVAFTQLRLALRSPRGRATMASPLLMPIVLAGLGYQRGGLSFLGIQGHYGLALAAIGSFSAILGSLPIALNQFAIDKAGFTRVMLSPISIGELVAGKAVGNAFIVAGPILFCCCLSAFIQPEGGASLWVALALGLVATFVLMAPAAAGLSAIFPKAVDLNSIGTGSNAHQAAALLGMLAFVVSAAPAVLVTIAAVKFFHRVELVPLFLFAWCVTAFAISFLLFIPVRRLVASRCETLAQYH